MAESWTRLLDRWTDAGVLDADAAARIRAFEQARVPAGRLKWWIWLALVFGALALGAGVLLFVAAHWDMLSPSNRFALVAFMVAAFHVGGAATATRFPGLATALHAVGTVALGAGIFLAGQIFNLEEHWPGGLMLWALGAAAAWGLLRDWPQMALLALLAPAWLIGEWTVATGHVPGPAAGEIVGAGTFLLAVAYLTAARAGSVTSHQRALQWIGGIALLPSALTLAFTSSQMAPGGPPLTPSLAMFGWTVALGLPLALAAALHRTAAWPHLLAALWVVALHAIPATLDLTTYVWWALAALGLAAWGVLEGRPDRINLGTAGFAITLLVFYFSHVMDKLGRSASLVGLGVLFLAGGWAIERVRRRLVLQTRGATS